MSTYQNEVLAELRAQKSILIAIANELKAMAGAPASPNYRRKLSEYLKFDWSEIGAEVVESDASGGAIEVEWHHHRFLRRSGSGKYGNAIWFSRPIGSGENGTEYAKLIAFKDYEPEPLAVEISSTTTSPPSPPEPDEAEPVAVVEEVEKEVKKEMEPHQAREAFYTLASKAIGAGKVGHDLVNKLVGCGDFTVAYRELCAVVA